MKLLRKLFPVSTNRRRRRFQMGIAIGLFAGLVAAGIVRLGGLNAYGARFSDLFNHPKPPSGKVVLVAIDDKTVDEYEWPIERVTHGAFLFGLNRAQPRVVVLDFFLPDPTTPEEDTFLAQIIQRSGKIVQPVLGIEVTRFSPLPNQFPSFDSILRPAPVFRTSNTTMAHAMIYPDSDGVTRRFPLLIDGPGERYPSIGLAALTLYQGREPSIESRDNQIFYNGKTLSVDQQGQVLINFIQRDAVQKISYTDITHGRVDPSVLRDKIVLVGPITRLVHESYNAPVTVANTLLSNVELQADMIETLLSENFVREQDPVSRTATVAVVALIAGASLIHLRRRYAAALSILYFAGYILYGFAQFDRGVILAPLDVAVALLLTLTATVAYRYIAEERTRALIARLFLGTVAPESVEQVLAQYDRGTLALTGGRREVSVLSITLRGLAPLSEAGPPEAVIEVMNEYSARIFEAVFQYGGSIYSQVANTIIAMWNLPLSHADHAQRAVQAAFEIQQQILRLGEKRAGRPHVESGLGVATGAVVAGQLTSSPRAEYSVIGDVVNVAERLSILATQNQIYVDSATRDQTDNKYESQRGQSIHLRGKKEPVEVWELLTRLTLKQIPLS